MRRVIQSYPSDGVDMEDEAALEESRADVDAIFRRVAAFAWYGNLDIHFPEKKDM